MYQICKKIVTDIISHSSPDKLMIEFYDLCISLCDRKSTMFTILIPSMSSDG